MWKRRPRLTELVPDPSLFPFPSRGSSEHSTDHSPDQQSSTESVCGVNKKGIESKRQETGGGTGFEMSQILLRGLLRRPSPAAVHSFPSHHRWIAGRQLSGGRHGINSLPSTTVRPGSLLRTTPSTATRILSRPSAVVFSSVSRFSTSAEPSIEEQYQKMSQREHILLRPEPYIGSMQVETRSRWGLDLDSWSQFLLPRSTTTVSDPLPQPKIISQDFTIIPALVQIFDEILVNAADNAQRRNGPSCMSRDNLSHDR